MGENSLKYGVCCCCVVVCVITAIVLIVTSISSLEANEMGLELNSVQQSINEEELFLNGQHFLGVGHSFIKYPKTLQSVKFSNVGGDGPAIQARTEDGLLVTLDVSFNFKLKSTITNVAPLYLQYGEMEDVTVAYNRIARNWVRAVASDFTAFEFFFNRTQIQVQMEQVLDFQLERAYGDVEALQLLNIDLPQQFDDARTRQETALQQIEQRQSEKNVATIDAQTSVEKARKEAEVILLEANAQVASIEFTATAAVQALEARFSAERESYAELARIVGLTSDELLSYIWLDAVKQGLSDSVVNLPLPAMVRNSL